ncbi:hypothetical protein CHLRE_16g648850v5 [Chlamydomonas reinhardtii]|uniref:Uncharacterized protein n=1 Tax=Chlamydomonas reinhardtii TaxID=3055 RepID=A0A2K3CSQ6_CHLRE|nr:uncharacterized protein CHLRE_16g648850v5 [Chlamydomonas reinhardtii]PNW71310.1 hypothetical protein CHLRE_16g648850v5 [Chlamydomonas reinhardtii]
MLPGRALRCSRGTHQPRIQAAASAWAAGVVPQGFVPLSRAASYHQSTRMASVAAASFPSAAAAAAATAASPGGAPRDPAALWRQIASVYDKAQVSGACSKTDTQVEMCRDAGLGVEFVLRVATALKAKPNGPPQPAQDKAAAAPSAPAPAPWRNPFSPPEPELTVGPLGPTGTHTAVLNKFNVVAHHVLVITNQFRSQAEPLHGADLAAALEVLQAMPEGGVAFYNCGPESGRSQPHKHLQVVPLPFMDGQPPRAPVDGLVEAAAAAGPGGGAAPLQPLQLRQLPYQCFATQLPDSPSPEQLGAAFDKLLQLAFPGYSYSPPPAMAALPPGASPTDAATAAAVAAGSVSYNVLMTRQWLLLAPRRTERCGPLALNSLAFAGTILVRSEEELGFVREKGPGSILAEIGVPW